MPSDAPPFSFQVTLTQPPMLRRHFNFLIAALRSGLFVQGQGYLTLILPDGSEKDCCLGVFSKCFNVPRIGLRSLDLSSCLKNGVPEGTKAVCYQDMTMTELGEMRVLPEQIRAILGGNLGTWKFSFLDRNGEPTSAASLNDDGFTYDQIADIFEYDTEITEE